MMQAKALLENGVTFRVVATVPGTRRAPPTVLAFECGGASHAEEQTSVLAHLFNVSCAVRLMCVPSPTHLGLP